MVVAAYVSEAPEISIDNGVACVRVRSDTETMRFHMPLVQFRIAVHRAHRVISEHDAAGCVLDFPGHHAA